MKQPIILFRDELSVEGELDCARQYFNTVEQRSSVPPNSLVIGRYSCLPYYKELETDLAANGSQLINTWRQHQWIASFEYYEVVKNFTFETWFNAVDLPYDGTQFVVKGVTNSRKHDWNNMMFASDKHRAIEIMWKLQQDSLIGQQQIIFRRYEPLITYEIGINGLPFTNEWRIFCYKQNIVVYGYYWSIADNTEHTLPQEALDFAQEIINVVHPHVNFYVLDIAQKVDGSWALVEINDGQMSGTSTCDLHKLYSNLQKLINTENY